MLCRRLLSWSVALGAALVFARAAHADGARLGHDVFPTTQTLGLIVDARKPDYTGTTSIAITVARPVVTFQINAREMKIDSLSLTRGEGGAIPVTFANAPHEQIAITAASPIPAGAYTLDIAFSNRFDTRAKGLYRLETGGESYAFTLFWPDAARAFFAKPGHAPVGLDRELAKVADQITECTTLRDREGGAVERYSPRPRPRRKGTARRRFRGAGGRDEPRQAPGSGSARSPRGSTACAWGRALRGAPPVRPATSPADDRRAAGRDGAVTWRGARGARGRERPTDRHPDSVYLRSTTGNGVGLRASGRTPDAPTGLKPEVGSLRPSATLVPALPG